MLTKVDEGKGIVKTDWKSVRTRVKKVNPDFATLVDALSPGKEFPLYLVYYPYGFLEGNAETILLPKITGGHFLLNNPDIPKNIIQDLGYGMHDAPLGLVLEKVFEMFVDSTIEDLTIPKVIYRPGDFTCLITNLNNVERKSTWLSNKTHARTAGVRSTFMLPNIGCVEQHADLKRFYNIRVPAPKQGYDHWEVFREIASSKAAQCEWRACQLFFSKPWIEKLHFDPAWMPLNLYLHKLAWQLIRPSLVKDQYNLAFSVVQHDRKLKPNPHLAGTAQHLYMIALGGALAHAPATDNLMLPLDVLQQAYLQAYRLKRYHSTIMQPSIFQIETSGPVYYSLNQPSTHIFSPTSRRLASMMMDMHELQDIESVLTEELQDSDTLGSDFVLHTAARKTLFSYYHSERDNQNALKHSSIIGLEDPRFAFLSPGLTHFPEAKFAADAAFARGCVRIQARQRIKNTN